MSDILDCGRTSVLNGVLFLIIAGNVIKYILCLQDVPLIVGKVFIVKVFAVNMFNLKALMKRLFNEKAFGCKYVQLQVYSAANTFAFGDAVLLHFFRWWKISSSERLMTRPFSLLIFYKTIVVFYQRCGRGFADT